jgi:ferritin-like metal-binding protein YciE
MKQTRPTHLRDLLIIKINSLFYIETQIIKALPKLVKKASNRDLKKDFEYRLKENKGQVKRLEQVFKLLDEKPKKVKVEAIRGLIKDAEWLIKNIKNPPALDAALIAISQYIEHYEIAGYGTAAEWAHLLGETEAAELLTQTLEEEEGADEKLNDLAITTINERALNE